MMKKIALVLAMLLPLVAAAQTKVKETAVPRSVILALEKTYDSYKVRTWYQAPGQYIAEVVIDGQDGRAYFTASGDWQYTAFPIKFEECPTLMTAFFTDNYPGYRVKSIDYIEEMNGDNYYRMMIIKKGIAERDYELIFDTRGKLMKSNAPDPAAVKRDYYTHTNPDATDAEVSKATKTETNRQASRPKPRTDEPMVVQFAPNEAAVADFEKSIGSKRCKTGPEWINRNDEYAVAYFTDTQKVEKEAVYDIHAGTPIMIGKVLPRDRYNNGIMKYLAEKFNGEKYKVEKMVVYEYNSKYRGADGKKPKPYTYVVVSQKVKGSREPKFIRMEFDSKGQFTNLLAQPLDEKDVQ